MSEIEPLVGGWLTGAVPHTDIGAVPLFEWVDKDKLFVDHAYQRLARTERSVRAIRKMVTTFRWAKFQPITVALRADGRYAVVDGQHRALAVIHHPGILSIPCWIVEAEQVSDQAGVFVGVNGDRSAMTPLQVFRAELAACEPDAIDVKRVLDMSGIEICWNIAARGVPPGQTQAIATVRRLLKTDDEKLVIDALKLLKAAHATRANQLRADVIKAVAMILKVHGSRLDRQRFERVVGQYDCDQITDAARAYKKVVGGSTVGGIVATLQKAYDKGLPVDRCLSYRHAA